MQVYHTRKIRNLAAFLLMISGISHVAQLWLRDTDGDVLLTALLGMLFLLLALGLSGQSRFALWASGEVAMAHAGSELAPGIDLYDALTLWHLSADIVVATLCLYILYRTRFAEMD